MTLYPLPAIMAAPPAERHPPAVAANQNHAGHDVAVAAPRRTQRRRPAGPERAAPVTVYDGPYREPRSKRRMALMSGLLLLLLGGAGLWASPNGGETEIAEPAAEAPAPAATTGALPIVGPGCRGGG
jgi:hypothetical protein